MGCARIPDLPTRHRGSSALSMLPLRQAAQTLKTSTQDSTYDWREDGAHLTPALLATISPSIMATLPGSHRAAILWRRSTSALSHGQDPKRTKTGLKPRNAA